MASKQMIKQLRDFFSDTEISTSWMMNHVKVSSCLGRKSIFIIIDNMNEQEFDWIAEEIL